MADKEGEGATASIAVVGFALASYVVALERGWISRQDAVERTLAALRFFARSEQSRHAEATGYKGFYYHFLDMGSGRRITGIRALDIVDTALLVTGALTSRAHFACDTPEEGEIRECAGAIFTRIDWLWCCNKTGRLQGWKPKSGFSRHRWEGYSEATILFVLGMGSPTHPLPAESFAAWTRNLPMEDPLRAAGSVLRARSSPSRTPGSIFAASGTNSWANAIATTSRTAGERRSCSANALANPEGFKGYGANCWGFSAGEGPGKTVLTVDGARRRFLGYAARGAPFGPEDGTIAASSAVSSLPFAPELAIPVLRHLIANALGVTPHGRLTSGFHPTFPSAGSAGWVSSGSLGLDQGILVLMIENYRSGTHLGDHARVPLFSAGIARAGFCGGWLGTP